MSLLFVFAILAIFWPSVLVYSNMKLPWLLLWHILLSVPFVKPMDRVEKRSRINKLRGALPKISQSALLAFSKAAQKGELPDIVNREEIRLAINDCAGQVTPFGPVVRTLSLETDSNKAHRSCNCTSTGHIVCCCQMQIFWQAHSRHTQPETKQCV